MLELIAFLASAGSCFDAIRVAFIRELVAVLRIAGAVKPSETGRSVFGERKLFRVVLALVENGVFAASNTAEDPHDCSTSGQSDKRKSERAQRSSKEGAQDRVVVNVKPVGENDELAAFRCVAVEDGAKDEGGEPASAGTDEGVESVQEPELGDQAKEDRWEDGGGTQVGDEEYFQDVDAGRERHVSSAGKLKLAR